jgi:hypothetical protein
VGLSFVVVGAAKRSNEAKAHAKSDTLFAVGRTGAGERRYL